MLDVRKLRVLRELSARGTIAATAEALSFTPSAISQQLSALERETGVELLAREGRRLTLTEPGRRLVARTDEVARGARGGRGRPRGQRRGGPGHGRRRGVPDRRRGPRRAGGQGPRRASTRR